MLGTVSKELREHVPFTLLGAAGGVGALVAMLYAHVPRDVSELLFDISHPAHILFSAMATAAMYRLHTRGRLWATVLVGYVGAVGIGTLSDCVIPFLGEWLLDLPNRDVHVGFIEEWWLVNPLALAGIAIACVWPKTKFPHAGHTLLSTFASVFHMSMAMGGQIGPTTIILIGVFLFLAVWVPCCTSDIVFPLLLARGSRGDSQSARGHDG